MLISNTNENGQLRMMEVLLVLKMQMNISGTNRVIRISGAFPLLVILACSHLLSGDNYYVYMIIAIVLIFTALIGWCPITWLLKMFGMI